MSFRSETKSHAFQRSMGPTRRFSLFFTLGASVVTLGMIPAATMSISSANAQSDSVSAASEDAVTSPNTLTESAGTSFSFTVTTGGTTIPQIRRMGALPSGVTLIDDHNGTATLGGTIPVVNANTHPRSYHFTVTATYRTGRYRSIATQPFTLNLGATDAPLATTDAPLGTRGCRWGWSWSRCRSGHTGSGPSGHTGSGPSGNTGSGPSGNTGSGPSGNTGSGPSGNTGSGPSGNTGSGPSGNTGS